ncbi:MAG: aldehyde dehydrogenase family protein [Archangiaceae bacterium]|nr:aldehyde dehydrogenase family protein [Archangiaceae bacterium]
MKPQRVPASVVSAGCQGHIRHEPRGAASSSRRGTTPSTSPSRRFICAIGAGNTAMLKPSELTPHLSAAMAKLVKEVFSEDEVALFEGERTGLAGAARGCRSTTSSSPAARRSARW